MDAIEMKIKVQSAVPTSLRRKKSEMVYQLAKVENSIIPIDQEPHILDYKYWYLVKNRFPYDMVFIENDMLLPRSGAANRVDLSMNELIELTQILDELSNQYDLVFENFKHRRSVTDLYHLQLGRCYMTREQMSL